MTRAAEIIAALQAGKPAPILERHTGMPYGWGLWLRALTEKLGAIRRDSADAIVHLFAERPVPATPRRPLALNRWQAFRSMFYQDWGPPLREDRRLRWFAGGVSFFMHLLFALLLILLAMIKLPPPPSAAEEESRVQIEIMGEGTPAEEGGGPPAAQSESAAAAAAAPAASPSSSAPAETAQASSVPQEEIPVPAPPVAQQNVQVTETPTPTTTFVLPPATPRSVEIAPPQVKPRELGVPTREVTVVEAPPAQRQLPQREIAIPQMAQPTQEVRQREIAAPLPQIRSVQIPSRTIAAPELRAPAQSVRQAEIAAPNRGTAASSSTANTASPSTTGDSARSPSAQQGTQPNSTAAGSSAAANRPGGLATPTRGDDWGASTRNTPGQTTGGRAGDGPGLFNADGSVRVPSNATGDTARPGAPGSKQQQRADADRASKWLERPEFPYEPSMFDKYWRPTNESLLAEWVRRSIREVDMKIPGTNKRVRCVVSILQAGGACSLFDPNLNEQPATARPPPDIPVKRNPIPTDS
ncbi:MAG: hypothetical protein ACREO0_16205 [Pseudoxanthomonas sp.]